MAVAPEVASKVEGSQSGGTVITLAAFTPTGANRFAFIGVAYFSDANTVASVTRTGDTPEFIGRIRNTVDGENGVEIWKILAPVTGAADVVVTLTNADDSAAFVINYNDVNQTTPHDGIQTNTGTGAPSITVGTSANDYVVDVLATTEGGETPGADQTSRMNQAPADMEGDGSDQDGVNGGAMTWSAAATHAHAAINLNEVGGAAPVVQGECGTIGNMFF